VPLSRPTRRFHVPSALQRTPARIDAEQARELLERGAVLVDVRRHDDSGPTQEGALRIPPDEIPERLAELSHGTPIVLGCT
jgi:rhodanese-related sulfurtransferase